MHMTHSALRQSVVSGFLGRRSAPREGGSRTELRAPLIAAFVAIASAFPAAQQKPLFTFHSNAWLNLHHYVRAVARGGPAPTGLTEEEQKQWAAGVEFYKPYAARDRAARRRDGRDQERAAWRRGQEQPRWHRDRPGAEVDARAADADLPDALVAGTRSRQPRMDCRHRAAGRSPWRGDQSVTRARLRRDLAGRADACGPVSRRRSGRRRSRPQSHHDLVLRPSYRGYAGLEMVFHEASHGSARSSALQPWRAAAAEGHTSAAVVARRAFLYRRRNDDARAQGARHRLHAVRGRELLRPACAAPAAATRSPSTGRRISTASARSPTRSPRSSPRSGRGGSSAFAKVGSRRDPTKAALTDGSPSANHPAGPP